MDLSLTQGFKDEPVDSSMTFRMLLDAMARPGTIHSLPVELGNAAGLNKGATLAILTLADHETHVWLDRKLSSETVKDFIRFNCSSQITPDKSKAMFAVFAGPPDIKTLSDFSIGTSDYPDASVTLIIQVENLTHELGVALQGPGIKSTQYLKVDGLSDDFWIWWRKNNGQFPLGMDVVLTTDKAIAALPRTVRVMESV